MKPAQAANLPQFRYTRLTVCAVYSKVSPHTIPVKDAREPTRLRRNRIHALPLAFHGLVVGWILSAGSGLLVPLVTCKTISPGSGWLEVQVSAGDIGVVAIVTVKQNFGPACGHVWQARPRRRPWMTIETGRWLHGRHTDISIQDRRRVDGRVGLHCGPRLLYGRECLVYQSYHLTDSLVTFRLSKGVDDSCSGARRHSMLWCAIWRRWRTCVGVIPQP